MANNPGDGSFDMRISVYSPPYMFNGARPQITSVASQEWHYGSTEQISTDSPIVSAELIRPAAVTHSSDPNQRYVDLPMTVNGNSIGLNVTSNPDMAPPGWYMLFVTNANGVPSVAQWVHLT
jgi:galactose oxidase-like protein